MDYIRFLLIVPLKQLTNISIQTIFTKQQIQKIPKNNIQINL